MLSKFGVLKVKWDGEKVSFDKPDKNPKEIIPQPLEDRRILANIPDVENERKLLSRRGVEAISKESEAKLNDINFNNPKLLREINEMGTRYESDIRVAVYSNKNFLFSARGINISNTGILLKTVDDKNISLNDEFILKFFLPEGVMPEGYESDVTIKSKVVSVRTDSDSQSDETDFCYYALKFNRTLKDFYQKNKWRWFEISSLLFLSIIVLVILLMRLENIEYFIYDIHLHAYSIIASVFLLTRYLFSVFYREVPIDPDYMPGVTIIIPCFNEEEWIQKTIVTCLDQQYDPEKLEVIVVDDGSTDRSIEKILEKYDQLKLHDDKFNIMERLKIVHPDKNEGKRHALMKGVMQAKHDLVTFVDSDSFLDPQAIRYLVQPFKDEKVGGVSGRTDVENIWTNWLTKMQAVRYYISFRVFKAAEAIFDTVSCLSGPLACYRKELVLKHKDAWLNQTFLWHPATFGDDRSLTNFLLTEYKTTYQDSAICSTIVPSGFMSFMKQQMRWKRSWLRESLRAAAFMWRKEPFASVSFYAGLFIPIVAPFVVLINLVYAPIIRGISPTTYVTGLILMGLLMSSVYLMLKRSRLWIYGAAFCFFYVFVLLWQMPIAYFTFHKSTWGTRMTASDVDAEEKKRKSKEKKLRKINKTIAER